ncbi:MAG: spondin domain-containing protein, partial [Burkholderiaceae bacterium]
DPLFTAGQIDRAQGLERIAEDGEPATLAAALPGRSGVVSSGAFATPTGASAPSAIGPGGAYEFTIQASSGDRLSLATMFVPSNDLFFSPDGQGIALYQASGAPVSGDVTSSLQLWDAGTEVNQEPGVGPDQVQRQSGANTGTSESRPVALVSDGFMYPSVASVIRVTVTPVR